MLYDDSEIKTDGIAVDELSDDEVIDNALNQSNINGDDDEEETPAGSQPEKKAEVETEKVEAPVDEKKVEDPQLKETETEEDKLPFHKHPRWKKVMDELKDLREFRENTTKTPEKVEDVKMPEMPKWYTDLYGENQEGWEAYVKQRQSEREEDRKAILADLEKRQKEAEEKVSKMDAWVDEQVQTLKDDPEIGAFDRNKLLKVMLDYKPTDDEGNLDFYKGYQILQLQDKKPAGENPDITKSKIKKAIASQTVQKSKSTENTGVMSTNDVRYKSFSQLAEE